MRECFICKRVETDYNRLDTHHIFGAGNRWKSDKYGLTVLLCRHCHTQSEYAVHNNADMMLYLHRYGQQKAMREQGWDCQTFVSIFGKNYLD